MLTESAIEAFAIKLLERQGYRHLHGAVIAPDGDSPERTGYGDVLLAGRMAQAVRRINHRLPAHAVEMAIKEVQRYTSPVLLDANEHFHRWMTEGVTVELQQDGQARGERVWLIDFARPEHNDFLVVNQFTVAHGQERKRMDLVLFVNGLPLVVVELKNAGSENATLKTAHQQIETYKQTIPALFQTNAWVVISDGLEARAGSLSAGLSRFMAWKSADGKAEASHLVSQLETLILGMLPPATLLDLLRHFIVFEKARREDPQTGQVTLSTVKKLAAYHQYYAVNAAVASTLRAADLGAPLAARETPASYGVPGVQDQPRGDRKAGVVWHTQGSGKSLTMVFVARMLRASQDLSDFKIVLVNDR
ncbi:MAG TPA: type I restriction endonuclease, partial [Burkholderiaceae bacterium]|nr:type I restriction endonuclease [Burkholderiaceae bacterium]